MIEQHWYRPSYTPLTRLLLPLSWSFRMAVLCRRTLYRWHIKKQYQFPCPVIVVGNISVGGTGKTPFVIWLAEVLRQAGFKPGIVSRGYGGKRQLTPIFVTKASSVEAVGDEAMLLSRRTQCPVVVAIDRVAAVNTLLSETDCNIVISDDGLQHYRMGRSLEIAIVDGVRRFGNRCLLPAGPLREPVSRLKQVDFVVAHQQAVAGEYQMLLQGDHLVALGDHNISMPLTAFLNTEVHAVAAIGDPQRFFTRLERMGLTVIPHAFPDHYRFQKTDLEFQDTLPIIMTEKDAVKCEAFADYHHWYLPVEAKLAPEFETALLKKLAQEAVCVELLEG